MISLLITIITSYCQTYWWSTASYYCWAPLPVVWLNPARLLWYHFIVSDLIFVITHYHTRRRPLFIDCTRYFQTIMNGMVRGVGGVGWKKVNVALLLSNYLRPSVAKSGDFVQKKWIKWILNRWTPLQPCIRSFKICFLCEIQCFVKDKLLTTNNIRLRIIYVGLINAQNSCRLKNTK